MNKQQKTLWDELVAMQAAPRDAFNKDDAAKIRRAETSCEGKVRRHKKRCDCCACEAAENATAKT